MRLHRSFCSLCALYCLLLPLLLACDALPTVSVSSSTQTPTPTTSAWHTTAPGVEVRQETWSIPQGGRDVIALARFDLRHVTLHVKYQPDHPLSMEDWIHQEQAAALINGGYFDGLDRATALVISDSQVSGTSYSGFGGMLAVDAQGHIQLRSLREQPYDPSERLTQATQSAPMLILHGQRTQFNADNHPAPRSVVAIDKQGRMLFIASPGAVFTLDA